MKRRIAEIVKNEKENKREKHTFFRNTSRDEITACFSVSTVIISSKDYP